MSKLSSLVATTLVASAGLLATPAFSAICGFDLGTAAPGGARPATVGGAAAAGVCVPAIATVTPIFPMTFADRTCQAAIPQFSLTTGFDMACGVGTPRPITFSSAFDKRTIGGGWATWSGVPPYAGVANPVVFYNLGVSGATRTVTLPPNIDAFALYTEPNSFSQFTYTIKDSTGATLTMPIVGASGARGAGFATGSADCSVKIISVDVTGAAGDAGWAWGEFSYHPCIPGTPTPTPTPTPTASPTPSPTPTPTGSPSPTPSATVTPVGDCKVCICHYPPGNPDNKHTICVGAPAIPAHLAHGDTLGDCP